MTPAQERMLAALRAASEREARKHPDSGGWVEWWHVADDWAGVRMPVQFVPIAATKTWQALERIGIVEAHPEFNDLVRPKAAA